MVTPSVRPGCTYEVANGRWTGRVKIVRYDAIARMHVVIYKGREMRLDLRRVRSLKTSRAPRKTNTSQVYLYMCDIGGGCFKIGATCNLDRRQKQIRTYAQRARMRAIVKLPLERGSEFRRFERAVLDDFAEHRVEGGSEVLRLSRTKAEECVQRMRSVV